MSAGADWIEWAGGECPVGPRTRVEVKFRGYPDEEDYECADAGVYSLGRNDNWKHEPYPVDGNHDGDIIAYRVVSA